MVECKHSTETGRYVSVGSPDSLLPEGWCTVTDLASNKMNKMKLGVVFPQTEIGSDPEVVANFADGWFPFFNSSFENQIKEVHEVAINAGRKPSDLYNIYIE
jgi:hypothetical protein